jgi:YD repeat-containing protein
VYGVDGLNRVNKTIEDPSGLALAMTVWYDALGRQTLVEDPAGQKTARLYDGLGRLTRLTEDYLRLFRGQLFRQLFRGQYTDCV